MLQLCLTPEKDTDRSLDLFTKNAPIMAKLLFIIVALFFMGSGVLAANTNDSVATAVIEASLRKQQWLPHQFFEIRLKSPSGTVFAYCGLEKQALSNTDSLKKDAKGMAEKMLEAIKERVKVVGMDFFVYYFDRASYLIGTTIIFKAVIRNEKIAELQQAIMHHDPQRLPLVDRRLIEQLHLLKLSPNQYILPFLRGDPLESGIGTVCLVNLELAHKSNTKPPELQQQYGQLLRVIPAEKLMKLIIIRYQDKFNYKLQTGHRLDMRK